MGKKRIIKKTGGEADKGLKSRSLARIPKKKLDAGILHIEATYNNTKVLLTDKKGDSVMWSSSGALGFKGAKKGTPFAAAKVGELLGEKASMIGVKDVDVVIKGVGGGRESALRGFITKGIQVSSIKDTTPVPHNGPRPKKTRRV
ncbi:MAG: 30S ribosomal protein S11 [Candidatus Pacebacteria bacterium]|jgi:small subunit ribosomal protein S11|nr:30S ribosomal protein S11 [Parcubacteria group bacterium]MDP6249603.1 30S ribosomal protein S11 [Candidatus Paceibacterota bacterium]MDP7159271.1 30S ribosomal protein S11 [Candidatus Paceibacterota bacterium]MDP7368811.1 30S ribosomal protein S11 [Candidatus Paceibacterota bacterium]MDP7466061.1 30S ribosomal protein S11 [Candidatus Paceibacterota bacterium]|tara:strand:- start:16450 stop:16884 length:435 start_codon:yes stop_codon:yes gene_type:complete